MPRLVTLPLLSMAVLGLAGCGGGEETSFCELAAEFESTDLSGDRASLESRVEAALATLDRLVEAAPDEIVSDVITIRDGVEEFARGGGRLGPTFDEASRRVTAHLDRECRP